MTVDDSGAGGQGCRYWRPGDAPPGVSFMVQGRRLVRVDVDSAGILTEKGVGIGSPESAVRAAYGTGLIDRAHKYQWEAGWRYLIYRSPGESDTLRAVVFESDGQKIRTLRAGLEPQVEYVERCG